MIKTPTVLHGIQQGHNYIDFQIFVNTLTKYFLLFIDGSNKCVIIQNMFRCSLV